MKLWESISFKTQMATGLKFYRKFADLWRTGCFSERKPLAWITTIQLEGMLEKEEPTLQSPETETSIRMIFVQTAHIQ